MIILERDPIPRMLSGDDFMGQWLRDRPSTASRAEQRAAVLTALFRGGWISANATADPSSSRLGLAAQAHAAEEGANIGTGTGESAVGLPPHVSGSSGGGLGLLAPDHEPRFEHVGTMHVIVPGSRRVSGHAFAPWQPNSRLHNTDKHNHS